MKYEYKVWTWKAKFEDGWSSQGGSSQLHFNLMEPEKVTINDVLKFIINQGEGRELISVNIEEVN